MSIDIYQQCRLIRETRLQSDKAFDADGNLLKLVTEVGELVEEWMRHTGRTRHPVSDLAAVEGEYTDALVTLILAGIAMGVDHERALKNKLAVIWDRLTPTA